MREIKFRAWDSQYKKWLKPFEWPYGHSGLWLNIENGELTHIEESGDNDITYTPFENIMLSQFTGLKDKNGKDIYEGDVIEHVRNDEEEDNDLDYVNEWKVRCVVEWQDGISKHLPHKDDNPSTANCNPQFVGKLLRGQKDGSYNWSEFHNCEVIGNIYENPELISK